jgi:chromate transporter
MDTRDGPGAQVPRLPIFLAFLRLGLTAFGGPAMVVYIREFAVTKKRWLSDGSFQRGVALCQSIPGATAMQTAAYAGLRAGGPWGALAAYVGFGLPAFALMVVLSAVYHSAHGLPTAVSAFRGLQIVVIALMANATLNFGSRAIDDWRDVIPAAGAAVFLGFHGSPIIAVAAAGALGLLLHLGVRESVPTESGESTDGPAETRSAAAVTALLVIVGLPVLFLLDRALFSLSALMLKVDVFAFGGGFASVPLMMHEVVERQHWLDSRAFMDGIALGQVTPGPIVITATFVGYQVGGILGAIVATVSIFAPSFFMVLATVPYFDRLQRSRPFRQALRGILASFVGLLMAVTVRFGIATPWSLPAVGLAVAAFAALRVKIDVLWVVLAGAAFSVFVL